MIVLCWLKKIVNLREKDERETKRKMYFTLSLILLFILFILFDENRRKEKIESFTISTIGLMSTYSIKGSHGHYNCRFYINNKSFVSKVSRKSRPIPILNQFYKVKYDKNNPENNHTFLNIKMHPDSLTLVKAGFESIKYYEHDIATNTYIERYKWQ